MNDKFNVYEVVKKLIGPIKPIGESNTDQDRLENLKKMTELIELLLDDVIKIETAYLYSPRHSEQVCGDFASKFLDETLNDR